MAHAERALNLQAIWQEQCRVAAKYGIPEPTFEEVQEHFAWFFSPPNLDKHGRWVEGVDG
jgi:hypothetical protein